LYDDALGFRFFYGNSLDSVCESSGSIVLKYYIALTCNGKVHAFRCTVGIEGFIESSQCLQNVTGIYFTIPAKRCSFNVNVSVGAGTIVSGLSNIFDVLPGVGSNAVLIGTGPNCASAGALVWSVNSTAEGLCLVAQLMDAESNNMTTPGNASVIARMVYSSHVEYSLSRTTFNASSDSGLIKWCDAYSGKQRDEGVVFGANVNGNIIYWNYSVINVSSAGPPTSIIPNMTAVMNNQTLSPGAMPLKLIFSFQDAGGNTVNRLADVAIRVRVVPRLNTTIGRLASMSASSSARARSLLQLSNFSTAACDRDTPLEFTFIQSLNSFNIIAGPEFLCRAGVNDIFFDVGTYAADVFSPTVSNAFTMSAAVSPGQFKFCSLVNFDGTFIAQSYSLINSMEIMFLDAGLNEVSGNATMSVASINASVFVYPSQPFTIVSNASFKTFLPPFFAYVADWIPSETPLQIGLTTVNSTLLQYGTNIVTLLLNRSCETGHRYDLSSYAELYSALKLNMGGMNASASAAPPAQCVKCINGTISNRFDAQKCRYVLSHVHLSVLFFSRFYSFVVA
jgi:hypothetical protein